MFTLKLVLVYRGAPLEMIGELNERARVMVRIVVCTLVFSFLIPVLALRAQDDSIKEKLDKAKSGYEADLKKLQAGLVADLQKKEAAARKAGDKKLVDQVLAEQEKFESDGTLPKVVSTTEYQRQARQIFRTVEIAYKQAIKEYLVAKKDDVADALGKELEDLRDAVDGKKAANAVLGQFRGQWTANVATGFRVEMQITMKDDKIQVSAGYYNNKNQLVGGFVGVDPAIKDGLLTFSQKFTQKPVNSWMDGKFHTLEMGTENTLKFSWKNGGTETFTRVIKK